MSMLNAQCYIFYIAVEDVEPVRKKLQLDIDRDSAMGLSVFTGEKSTTFSEASLRNFNYTLHIYLTCVDVPTHFFNRIPLTRSWKSWRSWILN